MDKLRKIGDMAIEVFFFIYKPIVIILFLFLLGAIFMYVFEALFGSENSVNDLPDWARWLVCIVVGTILYGLWEHSKENKD